VFVVLNDAAVMWNPGCMKTARRHVARHSSMVATLTSSLMRLLLYFTMVTVAANAEDVPGRRQTGM